MTVTSQVAAPPVAPGAASRRVPSRRRLARGWRALRTGVAFASFGVGAIVVAAITAVSARGVPARHAFRLWLWWMVWLRLCRVSWIDGERLAGSGPRLVVANHPTLIDVILLLARLSQADCIVKTAARRNPFMRRIVARAGYLANDDGDALVESCADRIAQGRSVLLFPEGTRSPRGGLHRFQRGAAHIALKSGCPIVPVVITCRPRRCSRVSRGTTFPMGGHSGCCASARRSTPRAISTRAAHCRWPPDDSPRICRRSTSRGSAPMRSIHDAARSVQGRNLQALA